MILSNAPRGTVLLLAVLIFAILSAAGISGASVIIRRLAGGRQIGLSAQSFAAAEAGIDDALYHLKLDKKNGFQPGHYTLKLGNGVTVIRTVTPMGGSTRIDSTATIFGVEQTVTITTTP